MKSNWKYKGNTTKPGKHIWDEYENEETGQSTLDVHEIRKISNWDKCKHHYRLIDNNSNYQCQRCELGGRLVWGIQFIKDGQIVDKL